jgi:hypothetical protein
VEGHLQTCISQAHLLHKEFQHPWHVVLIAQTNLRTLSQAQVVLLSSNLELAYTARVDYYGLRFHIEIVSTQMTKGGGFACGPCRHHRADFHLGIVDDDPSNE